MTARPAKSGVRAQPRGCSRHSRTVAVSATAGEVTVERPGWACQGEKAPSRAAAERSRGSLRKEFDLARATEVDPAISPSALSSLASRASRVGGLRAPADYRSQGRSTHPSSCGVAQAIKQRRTTSRRTYHLRDVLTRFGAPRLHLMCSGPVYRVRSKSSCPRSHSSPGSISSPQRAQKAMPAETTVVSSRRSAWCAAPYPRSAVEPRKRRRLRFIARDPRQSRRTPPNRGRNEKLWVRVRISPLKTRGPPTTLRCVKAVWQGRLAQTAAKYGDNAPTAAVCCNVCRTCVQTNMLSLALGGLMAAGYAVLRITRRATGALTP